MKQSFVDLIKLMEELRGPNGCDWDKAQSIDSFVKYLREETEEIEQAVEKKDYENLKEELGDLLWNVLFMSFLAQEEGLFDLKQVMNDVRDKMIRRHEHVFGDKKFESVEEILENWEKLKNNEKKKD